MADSKISDLTATTAVADADEYVVANAGASKKITGANLKAGVIAAAFDATNPTTQAFGDAAAVGSATSAARRDHKHAMPGSPWGFTTGLWYAPNRAPSNVQAVSATQNQINYVPFYVPVSTSFQAIGAWVATLQASNTFRLGIWRDNGAGAPGVLIVDAGTISGASTGFKSIATTNVLSGLVWLGVVEQGGSGGAIIYWAASISGFGSSTSGNGVTLQSVSTSVSGALPNPAGSSQIVALNTAYTAPWIQLQAT